MWAEGVNLKCVLGLWRCGKCPLREYWYLKSTWIKGGLGWKARKFDNAGVNIFCGKVKRSSVT
jgi:hypothetical protein